MDEETPPAKDIVPESLEHIAIEKMEKYPVNLYRVIIGGNIGAGKTSVLDKLEKAGVQNTDVHVVYTREPTDAWESYLMDMYSAKGHQRSVCTSLFQVRHESYRA